MVDQVLMADPVGAVAWMVRLFVVEAPLRLCLVMVIQGQVVVAQADRVV